MGTVMAHDAPPLAHFKRKMAIYRLHRFALFQRTFARPWCSFHVNFQCVKIPYHKIKHR